MIDRRDAQYILSEIRMIGYFKRRIGVMQKMIDDIEIEIAEITEPKSPNGKTDVSVKSDGRTSNVESRINALISRQMNVEKEKSVFDFRLWKATAYFNRLKNTNESDFVEDFFESGKTHRQLEEKYHLSNAYDRMVRIIRNAIMKV